MIIDYLCFKPIKLCFSMYLQGQVMMMEVWDKQVVAAVDVPFHGKTTLFTLLCIYNYIVNTKTLRLDE